MNTIVNNNYFPVVVEDNLDKYLTSIADIPVLSKEEEYILAKEYKENGSVEAAQKLVLANLKFVAHIVRGYSGYGLNQADLIQEGNIGLMKAVKKFDPERKIKLISFAVHWIRAEIHEFVIRNWRIVKIATTKEQRKLFFNLRKNKIKLGYADKEETSRIAERLNVSEKSVEEMDKRMSYSEYSFDAPESNDDEMYSPSEYLVSNDNPENSIKEYEVTQKQKNVVKSLAVLDDRSQDIIEKRWLNEPKATLRDLADKYCISVERIRQIESKAMQKMKTVLQT